MGELKVLVQKMRSLSLHNIALSREWVLEQLIEVVFMAKAQEKPDLAGANEALNLLSLELGMFVERKETGKPGAFDGLTIASKRARVLDIARQLGLDRFRDERRAFEGETIDIEPDRDSS